MTTRQSTAWILGLWSLSLCILLISATASGDTPWQIVWKGAKLRLSGESTLWNALIDERLPRALLLLFSGSALAAAGAIMQALFQTPLASTTVLGSSMGGSLLMLPIIVFGWHLTFPPSLALAAICGSLFALLVVYLLWKQSGKYEISSLLLIGLAITAILAAIESALLFSLRNQWQLVQLLSELNAGSPSFLGWKQLQLLLPPTLIALFGCLYYRQELDLLALGDEEATSLGVDVAKVRWRLFLCVALLCGSTLATVGNIAFFGMLLPCALREIYGPSHRLLLPLCILAGGATLLAIDTLLRLVGTDSLSVNHLSGLIGSVLFLALCLKK